MPHVHELEADPVDPRVQSRSDGLSAKGHAPKVGCTSATRLVFKNVSTHCADCHADIHRRQFGAQLRRLPHGEGLAGFDRADPRSPESFPAGGRACHGGVRRLPQGRGYRAVHGAIHGLLFLPPEGFSNTGSRSLGGFPTTCENCHTMDNWFKAKFDHLEMTGYALTGVHATLPCTACHMNNRFKGTPSTCYWLPGEDFTRATIRRTCSRAAARLRHMPLHHQLAECQVRSRLYEIPVDRDARERDLRAVPCEQQLMSTPTACYSCHRADFTAQTVRTT